MQRVSGAKDIAAADFRGKGVLGRPVIRIVLVLTREGCRMDYSAGTHFQLQDASEGLAQQFLM